jgi:hypothetical protein
VEKRTPLNAHINASCTALNMLDGLVVIFVPVARLGPEPPGHWVPIVARGGFLNALDAVGAPRHTTVYGHFSPCIAQWSPVSSLGQPLLVACLYTIIFTTFSEMALLGPSNILQLTWSPLVAL